jgi:uncharacterized membrane-anchored protein
MFAALFAVPALAYWLVGLNGIVAFWFAYIITRPLGASFADWMGVPAGRSGLGWGTGPVSLVLAVVIVALVGYLTVTHRGLARDDLAQDDRTRDHWTRDLPLPTQQYPDDTARLNLPR